MRVLTPTDPAFNALVASSHQRFARLVEEAETKARPFYKKVLGHEASIEQVIDEILAAVEAEGDAAVARYGKIFDGAALDPAKLRVTDAEIEAGWNATDPTLRAAMVTAIEQVRAYQTRLLPKGFGEDLKESLGVRWSPLTRVGAYVPGGAQGSLPLFSSVIMNLVPAVVAGVPEPVLVTPPRPDGTLAPELLAAAKAVGIREIYKVGGVQAIAALAVGTATIKAVDLICGPGNIFVTLAKKRVFGRVNIDMLAGPSEVLVIADGAADPRFIAADLLSQAEHDTLAVAICLGVGAQADAIAAEVQRQLAALPAARRATAEASIAHHGVLVRCGSLDEAIAISNRIAPEHLEVLVADPKAVVPRLTNAGAIFVGPWSPEPIGDYVAGPSHTLPTGGTARRWSGIGVDTFMKRTSLINLSEQDFRRLAPAGLALARGEGLEAHARSIEVRLG